MSPRPRVSVCIPAFNAATTIGTTLSSVLAQEVDDLEVIVSDNASSDDTVAVIEAFGRSDVRILRQARNIGMVHNYEAVIGASRGDYVKLLCADDVLYPGAIRRELETLLDAGPGIAMVAARRDVVVEGWGRLPRLSSGARRGVEDGAACRRRIVGNGRNLIGEGQSVLMRGDVARRVVAAGLGDPFVVDLSLWFGVLGHGSVVHLPHRHGAFSVSRRSQSWELRSRQAREVRSFLDAQGSALGVSHPRRLMGRGRARLGVMARMLLFSVSRR